jgi:hypothetical protein
VASQLDVYNMALAFLDSSQTVKSLNDNSDAAGACNQFYPWARQYTLEKAPWGFASKMPAMQLILDQNTLPTNEIIYPGWRYVYQRPNDCLRFLSVTTQYGLRVNPFLAFWWRAGAMDCSAGSWGPFRPPWREVLDQVATPPGNAIDILTDQDSAYAVYVADVPNVALWTQSFLQAVAWRLAIPIAGPISANQMAKMNAVKQAEASLTQALQVALNEMQEDPYPDSPAITARN